MRLFRLAALFCLVAAAASGQDFYRSNALGMQGERLEGEDYSLGDYVLRVTRAESEVRILLNRGQEVRRSVITRLPERRLEERQIEEGLERYLLTGPEGLLEEAYRRDGLVLRRWEFLYGHEGRLRERFFFSNQERLWRDRLYYEPDGGLLSIVRYHADGTVESDGSSSERADWYQRRTRETVRSEVTRYGSGGYRRFLWDEGELVRQEQYEELPEGARIRVAQEGNSILRRLDEQGRILYEEEWAGDSLIIKHEYFYSGELLVEKIEQTGDQRRLFRYRYDEAGTLQAEQRYRNGVPARDIRYGGDDRREEIIYRRGEPFLRVVFENDEEILSERLP